MKNKPTATTNSKNKPIQEIKPGSFVRLNNEKNRKGQFVWAVLLYLGFVSLHNSDDVYIFLTLNGEIYKTFGTRFLSNLTEINY